MPTPTNRSAYPSCDPGCRGARTAESGVRPAFSSLLVGVVVSPIALCDGKEHTMPRSHWAPGPDEGIIGIVGELDALAYKLDACRSGKGRETILRDLQAASDRLDAQLLATCGDSLEPMTTGGRIDG